MTPQPEQKFLSLHDYLMIVWQRMWLIVPIIIVATVVGYYNEARHTPMYSSTTTIIYEKMMNISSLINGLGDWGNPSTATLETAGVNAAVQNPETTNRVRILVGDEVVDRAAYAVSATASSPDRDAMYTNMANITVVSSDPEQAAILADAYAKAHTELRKEHQKLIIGRSGSALKTQLTRYADPALHASTDYIMLKQRLQDLQVLGQTVTGDFRVVTPASVSTKPFAPNPVRSAMLGLCMGSFIGLGLAFLLNQLDTRLRDYREAADILGMPVVGRIPKLSKKTLAESQLVVLARPGGRTAEAFRLLRGNLEFMNVDQDVHSIFMASCLTGEGKSMTIANLAASLALSHKKVILIDGDLRKPTLHTMFGLPNESGLSALLAGRITFEEALKEVTLTPGTSRGGNGWGSSRAQDIIRVTLPVLTAGPPPPNPGELIASKRFAELIHALPQRYDLVLVDTPAMMAVGDVAALASSIDAMLVLVDFELARRHTLSEAIDIIAPLPCRKLGIIAAQERVKARDAYRYGYYEYGGHRSNGRASSKAKAKAMIKV